jgi:hypothetical protein
MNSFVLGVAAACFAFFGHWFVALPMLALACYFAAHET